jgi:deoxyribonucleoside regulator
VEAEIVATSTSNGRVAEPPADAAPNGGATPEDLRLALRAATLYYLDGLTQAEIATKLGVSRPTAGRLIARAKARGLVRIEVVVPPTMKDDLHAEEERLIEQRYGLTEAV